MVKRIPFTELFIDVTRKATKIPAGQYGIQGAHPIIDQSQNAIAGYSMSDAGLYDDVPAIVFGDHTCAVKYVEEPFFIGADGTKVLKRIRKEDDLRYLYYAISSANLPEGGYTRHFKWLKECSFAVPAVQEQRRISALLDQVKEQISLAAQMLAKTEELVQSRFVEMFGDPSRERVTLADVCDFYSGGTPSKRKPEYWDGTLPWFSPKDMKRPVLDDSIDHISDTVVEQTSLRLLPSDTVVIVVRGMILSHDVPVSIITVPATINQDMKALIPKLGKECDSVYLAAAIRSQENYLLAETSSSAHGTKKIDATVLGAVSIPEANIHEQREFAAFVRQVESLKTDLNQQLDRLNTLYDSLTQRYFA